MQTYDLIGAGQWKSRGQIVPTGTGANTQDAAIAFAQPDLPYVAGLQAPAPEFLVFASPRREVIQVRSWDENNRVWSEAIDFTLPVSKLLT